VTRTTRSRKVRWLVPVGVLAVVAAGATLTAGAAGASSPDLPERSAAQLLAAVAQATPQPFSGTVTETADLGLPALPGTSSTSLSWQSLVTGTHTAKVWVASPQQVRLALVGDLSESDVVRNGRDVWVWQSGANTVDHVALPAGSGTPQAAPSAMPSITPDTVAAKVLAALDPTTKVVVDRTATVAGRPVYQLVITPLQTGSLVSSVRIAIDGETSMPLGVQVYAVGQDTPALETEFTSITFATPEASVFAFSAPAGATVTEHVPAKTGSAPSTPSSSAAATQKPTVIGTGWTTVVEAAGLPSLVDGLPQGSGSAASQSTAALDLLLRAATPVSGSYGSGRVIETSLLTVLLLDDGRVFAGAVTPAVLEQAASTAK
jgi:outer membrane lipoprotein-sorting protein